MPIRASITLSFVLFFGAALLGQPRAELEKQLSQVSAPTERWDILHKLSRSWFLDDLAKAADYAQQSAQLAADLKDAQKRAKSAIIQAEIAQKNGRLAAARSFFEQAKTAADEAQLAGLTLDALANLHKLSAEQGDHKAAYQWGLEWATRAQIEANRAAAEQKKQHEATQQETIQQKDRERNILFGVLALCAIGFIWFFYSRQRANRRIAGELAEKNALIEEKRRRSEQLLLNILPRNVAAELTVRNKVAARRYERATVMFVDFVGFTQAAERLQPEDVVAELDFCFSRFDAIIGRYRIEKIKTVGDAYICASGLSDRNEHPADMIRAALEMQAFLQDLQTKREAEGRPHFEARIGIHFGPVVAGVVGAKKFAYDIWGDTVNTAARMEETCEPGRVNVSGAVYEMAQSDFQWTFRGKVSAKNKSEMAMYYVG